MLKHSDYNLNLILRMKVSLIFIALAIFTSRIKAEWHQVWEDEFDGTTLNETKWKHDEGCDGRFFYKTVYAFSFSLKILKQF
jgi:beta-glucanase (GH16 family)